MIVKCLCKHDEQDKKYGPGNRVANLTKDPTRARCTICKALVTVPKTESKEEKKGA